MTLVVCRVVNEQVALVYAMRNLREVEVSKEKNQSQTFGSQDILPLSLISPFVTIARKKEKFQEHLEDSAGSQDLFQSPQKKRFPEEQELSSEGLFADLSQNTLAEIERVMKNGNPPPTKNSTGTEANPFIEVVPPPAAKISAFQTAAGKPVKQASEASVQRSNLLLEQEDSHSQKENHLPPSPLFSSFKSASGKSIAAVKPESFQKALQVCKTEDAKPRIPLAPLKVLPSIAKPISICDPTPSLRKKTTNFIAHPKPTLNDRPPVTKLNQVSLPSTVLFPLDSLPSLERRCQFFLSLLNSIQSGNRLEREESEFSSFPSFSQFKIAFLSMLQQKSLLEKPPSADWIKNHLFFIRWKMESAWLASETFAYTARDVERELLLRLQIERREGKRSLLQRISEFDESPAVRMILIVVEIIPEDFATGSSMSLVLSDGWYKLKARIDEPMKWLVLRGKIRCGAKLHICCAQLEGSSGNVAAAKPILEAFDRNFFRLSTNSVRRARDDLPLGKSKSQTPFATGLRSVYTDGGVIPCLDVVVDRVYPLSYLNNGVVVSCSEFDAIQRRLTAQLELSSNSLVEGFLSKHGILNGAQIPTHLQLEIEKERFSLIDSFPKATSLLRFRITDFDSTKQFLSESTSAIFTYWRPSESLCQLIKEGSRLLIFSARASSKFQGSLNISNCKFTTIISAFISPDYRNRFVEKRKFFRDFSEIPLGSECDIHCSITPAASTQSSYSMEKPSLCFELRDFNGNIGSIRLPRSQRISSSIVKLKNIFFNFFDSTASLFVFTFNDFSELLVNV